MLDLYEALEALKQTGTMGLAGARLRVSQSAVSKRIAALEAQTGRKLIEKHGRRVHLTSDAEQLITRIASLLAELRRELSVTTKTASTTLTLGVSESVLASWGAGVLHKAEQQTAPLRLSLHAHRGALLTQYVASGHYAAALIAGDPVQGSPLGVYELGREPMVLLTPARTAALGAPKHLELISIEPQAGTWQAIKRRATKAGLVPDRFVESYFAAAQLASAGFGRALVPQGVTSSLRMPRGTQVSPVSGVNRPLSLIAQRHVLARSDVQALAQALKHLISGDPWRRT